MPADERLKVVFDSVFVKNDADWFGSGEFFFEAEVDGVPVGDRTRIFNAVENTVIILPEADWSTIVDVRNKPEIVVRFGGKDEDVFVDDDLGTIQHRIRPPYRQRFFAQSTAFFILRWHVELSVDGQFGFHLPSEVFACRQNAGGVTCTTVSGASFPARMEFHPVRPVPTTPPASALPNRPAIATVPVENNGNASPQAGSPMNVVPNPAVIPILGPPSAAPMGPHTARQLDEGNWANDRNVARIEFTFYQPASLAFTDDDDRLEWSVVSVAGGARVKFLRSDGTAADTDVGQRVRVFGTRAGEVRLEVRFKGALFAKYRALVQNVRLLPCRCQILNGTTADSTPRARPEDVRDHIDLSNRFLRQAGIALTLDTDPQRRNGATATAFPGIFRIRVARGRTRNLTNVESATILNHRPGVMNFAYIHSDDVGNLGAATDYPASGAGATITDPPTGVAATNADPSTSWVRPTGVGIGADATPGRVTMNLLTARQRAGHPQLFAMYVTDANGGPAGSDHTALPRQQTFAGTMAHEFGHILNLGHRVEGVPAAPPAAARDMTAADPVATLNAGGIFWDGLIHPPHENVMHWIDPTSIAQDFDIIQSRAIAQSPLVTGAPSLPPATTPGPVPPRGNGSAVEYVIQYGDWLSKIAQEHGMTWQELWNYDGGTGTPNKARLMSGDPDEIYPGETILVPGNPA